MIAMPKNLPQPQLKPNTEVVLQKRYLRKNLDGKIEESPRDLFWRVASAIAGEEAKYDKSSRKPAELARDFYDLMTSWKFLPNSPTLMNAGTDLGQLSACFVLPVEDSMEAIFETVKNAALIHKSGGGTAFRSPVCGRTARPSIPQAAWPPAPSALCACSIWLPRP